jgi:hypothetical protein
VDHVLLIQILVGKPEGKRHFLGVGRKITFKYLNKCGVCV